MGEFNGCLTFVTTNVMARVDREKGTTFNNRLCLERGYGR